MASCEQGTIEQASLHETPTPDASRDATEATPLVTSNHGKYGKNKSVLIKSKAAIMILIWTALMSFIYGGFLNPENYFACSTYLLMLIPISFTSEMMNSCIYAVFAFWLLFYPLAGYLADVRYGRYKVVRCSVCTMWCGLLTVIVIGVIVNAIVVPIMITNQSYFVSAVSILLIVVNCALALFLLISLLVVFAGFLANVIQFGVDQLNESPSKDSFLFIHWFLFTLYIGVSLGKLIWSATFAANNVLGLSIFGLVMLVVLICVPVTFVLLSADGLLLTLALVTLTKRLQELSALQKETRFLFNAVPLHSGRMTYPPDWI